jgi:DNA repair protein RecN (Recombination protein N)
MLSSLYIRNYAIIRELKINFSEGLSTITGETGAGKSILLGALSLILGQRADTTVLQDKDSKCIIEGEFDSIPEVVKQILVRNEIETGDPLILRREIQPSGKSRAFANDTPVNLQVLNDIGFLLVDIHSQHQNLNLGNNHYQLQVLDAFAQNDKLLDTFQGHYSSYSKLKREYKALLSQKSENQKELEFLIFQFEELEKAKIIEGELEELESELEILQHTEEIKNALFSTADLLNDEENGINLKLKQIESELQKISRYHEISAQLRERISSSLIELKDIAMESEQLAEKTEHDPARQEFVEDRIGLIYKLLQKHNKETVRDLIEYFIGIEKRITELGSYEFRLEKLEKALEENREQVDSSGQMLSRARNSHIARLEEKIISLLQQMGIPNANFKINNSISEEPGENGFDRITFLFSANKKSELKDISKIASGGELSRLMLTIKYIISHSLGLPTIIFDEIDTGVSGEIAHRVSLIMKEMSKDRQVFTITHLPQVAARGKHHFLVYKTDENSHTETRLRLLSDEERLEEIAKMLSGEQTTKAAIENARVLLGL